MSAQPKITLSLFVGRGVSEYEAGGESAQVTAPGGRKSSGRMISSKCFPSSNLPEL